MTDHGSFKIFTKRIGKTERQVDTAKHTLFDCARTAYDKEQPECVVGVQLTPKNIIDIMIRDEDPFNAILQVLLKKTSSEKRKTKETKYKTATPQK